MVVTASWLATVASGVAASVAAAASPPVVGACAAGWAQAANTSALINNTSGNVRSDILACIKLLSRTECDTQGELL